jgi:hypothetical protein
MKPFVASKTHTGNHIRVDYGADDSIPEGTLFMIQSPPPDWIISTLPLCSLCLRGEPDLPLHSDTGFWG